MSQRSRAAADFARARRRPSRSPELTMLATVVVVVVVVAAAFVVDDASAQVQCSLSSCPSTCCSNIVIACTAKCSGSTNVCLTNGTCVAPPTPAPTTAEPTPSPTTEPTPVPTPQPTTPEPTPSPTAEPTVEPTATPTREPSPQPTATPTAEPTATPTTEPSPSPTAIGYTYEPTPLPTTPSPTTEPSPSPSSPPSSSEPSTEPTSEPTAIGETTVATTPTTTSTTSTTVTNGTTTTEASGNASTSPTSSSTSSTSSTSTFSASANAPSSLLSGDEEEFTLIVAVGVLLLLICCICFLVAAIARRRRQTTRRGRDVGQRRRSPSPATAAAAGSLDDTLLKPPSASRAAAAASATARRVDSALNDVLLHVCFRPTYDAAAAEAELTRNNLVGGFIVRPLPKTSRDETSFVLSYMTPHEEVEHERFTYDHASASWILDRDSSVAGSFNAVLRVFDLDASTTQAFTLPLMFSTPTPNSPGRAGVYDSVTRSLTAVSDSSSEGSVGSAGASFYRKTRRGEYERVAPETLLMGGAGGALMPAASAFMRGVDNEYHAVSLKPKANASEYEVVMEADDPSMARSTSRGSRSRSRNQSKQSAGSKNSMPSDDDDGAGGGGLSGGGGGGGGGVYGQLQLKEPSSYSTMVDGFAQSGSSRSARRRKRRSDEPSRDEHVTYAKADELSDRGSMSRSPARADVTYANADELSARSPKGMRRASSARRRGGRGGGGGDTVMMIDSDALVYGTVDDARRMPAPFTSAAMEDVAGGLFETEADFNRQS